VASPGCRQRGARPLSRPVAARTARGCRTLPNPSSRPTPSRAGPPRPPPPSRRSSQVRIKSPRRPRARRRPPWPPSCCATAAACPPGSRGRRPAAARGTRRWSRPPALLRRRPAPRPRERRAARGGRGAAAPPRAPFPPRAGRLEDGEGGADRFADVALTRVRVFNGSHLRRDRATPRGGTMRRDRATPMSSSGRARLSPSHTRRAAAPIDPRPPQRIRLLASIPRDRSERSVRLPRVLTSAAPGLTASHCRCG
jgi:hypothetical protein